jgi:hypothetical protein
VSVDSGPALADVERVALRVDATPPVSLDSDARVSPFLWANGVPTSVLVDRGSVAPRRHVGPVTVGDIVLDAVARPGARAASALSLAPARGRSGVCL